MKADGFFWEILRNDKSIATFVEDARQHNDSNALLFTETIEALPDRPAFMPIAVQIEPTDHCNMRCDYCPHREKGNQAGALKLSQFQHILEVLPQVRRIHLQGLGEPFLCRDLFSMISYVKQRGGYVSTATNGTICTPRILGRILDSGLDELDVSLDSLDTTVVESQRQGGDIKRIWHNLQQFAMLSPKLHIRIFSVATLVNLKTLPALISSIAETGIVHVFVQEVQTQFTPSSCQLTPPSMSHPELAQYWYQKTVDQGKALGVEVLIAPRSQCVARQSCLWPWTSAYIKANGDVTPCCISLDDVCGNLFRQSWIEIWQNYLYSGFRQGLSKGPLPRPCINCNYL